MATCREGNIHGHPPSGTLIHWQQDDLQNKFAAEWTCPAPHCPQSVNTRPVVQAQQHQQTGANIQRTRKNTLPVDAARA